MTTARSLSAAVLADWIGDPAQLDNRCGPPDSNPPEKSAAERTAEELEAAAVDGFVSKECRRLIGEHVRSLVTQAWECPLPKSGDGRLQVVLDAVHALVHPAAVEPLAASIAAVAARCLAEPQQYYRQAFQRFIEQARTELVEGRRSIAGTDGLLRRLVKDTAGSQHRIQSALDALRLECRRLVDEFGRLSISGVTTVNDPSKSPSDAEALRKKLESAVSNYAMLECCVAIHAGVADALARGVDDLKQWQIVISENLTRCITQQQKLASAASGKAEESSVDHLPGGSDIAERSADVVGFAAQTRQLLKAVFPAAVADGNAELGSFSQQLLRVAEQFVVGAESGIQVPPTGIETNVERLVRKLPNCGGSFRCLAVAPKLAAAQDGVAELEERLGTKVARITTEDENTLLGFEAWNLDPAIFLHQVLGADPAVADLATRLHSRIDVNW